MKILKRIRKILKREVLYLIIKILDLQIFTNDITLFLNIDLYYELLKNGAYDFNLGEGTSKGITLHIKRCPFDTTELSDFKPNLIKN